MHSRIGKLSLAANYGYIDAKFESALTLNSPSNSSADPSGDIRVSPGNKVPGIPEHSLKVRMEYDFTKLFQWQPTSCISRPSMRAATKTIRTPTENFPAIRW
jgi:hypothetical protein